MYIKKLHNNYPRIKSILNVPESVLSQSSICKNRTLKYHKVKSAYISEIWLLIDRKKSIIHIVYLSLAKNTTCHFNAHNLKK